MHVKTLKEVNRPLGTVSLQFIHSKVANRNMSKIKFYVFDTVIRRIVLTAISEADSEGE